MSGGTAGQREGHLYTDIKLRLGKLSLLTSLYEKNNSSGKREKGLVLY